MTASISAPTAPTPAPSVGVQTPSQIAPSTPSTSKTTSSVLEQHRADSSSWRRSTGAAAAQPSGGIAAAARVSPTSSGFSMAAITT